MTELRLGISPCPNDVFIFSGILTGAVTAPDLRLVVDFQDIENLNERAQAENRDIVKISYANYVRCGDAYELLDCGGALGRNCGPLLLTHGSRWDPEREVLVPGENTTANFLLDFFTRKPLRKRFLPFDALYDELRRRPGAQGVVIHEKRFTFAGDGLALVQDLGAYWEEETGCPIPLGAIVARRSLGLKEPLEALIRESLGWAERHRSEALALCRRHAQDLNDTVIAAHIALYVNEYSHDLGSDGQAAVDFFLKQQREFLRAGSMP